MGRNKGGGPIGKELGESGHCSGQVSGASSDLKGRGKQAAHAGRADVQLTSSGKINPEVPA